MVCKYASFERAFVSFFQAFHIVVFQCALLVCVECFAVDGFIVYFVAEKAFLWLKKKHLSFIFSKFAVRE